MTNLPTKSNLTSSAATESQFQTAIGAVYDYLGELFCAGAEEAKVISGGSITPARGLIQVDTEGGNAIDDLDLIVATGIGAKVIVVRAASAARVVTLRHNQTGTGKLWLNGAANAVLRDPTYAIALYWNATTSRWEEIWRNFGFYVTAAAEITAIKTTLGLGTASTKDFGVSTGQIPLKENFGSAAFVNTGTSSGQVPLANQLGALAFLSSVTNSQLDATGITPGTYDKVIINAQGRATGGTLAGASAYVTRVYTSGSTWTKPAGLKGIDILGIAPGGGGGGLGAVKGTAGGDIAFGAYVTATGGKGGGSQSNGNATGGLGGVGTAGDFLAHGEAGQDRGTGTSALTGYMYGGNAGFASPIAQAGFGGGRYDGLFSVGGSYGGGGSSFGTAGDRGSGGGGGGAAYKFLDAASVSSTVTITIGAVGTGQGGGANGGPGVVVVREYY